MSDSSTLRALYLERMGIEVWRPRVVLGERPATQSVPEAPVSVVADGASAMVPTQPTEVEVDMPSAAAPSDSWEALQEEVSGCTRCKLCQSRTQTVFGVGSTTARVVVIGEGPGAEEDRRGEPFVGPAGKLLDNMLRAIGLARDTVYIANIVKCRPPNNRDPEADEVEACDGYLQRQLALIEPELIVAVGRVAAQNLLKTEAPLGRLRGDVHHYGSRRIPVVVTYHPAYLLRSPQEKARAWQDLKLVRRQLA